MKKLSTRALLFLAGKCIRHYAREHHISAASLDEFCSHLEGYATTDNILEWDTLAQNMAISGYGDPLPEELLKHYPKYCEQIHMLTQNAREISASQMYTEWDYAAGRTFCKRFSMSENGQVELLKHSMIMIRQMMDGVRLLRET